NSGQFRWTPSFTQAGDYALDVRAQDPGGLSATTTVHLHIDNVNRPPVLQVSDHSVVLGQRLRFTLTAADPDPGTILEFSATGLPEGAGPVDGKTGEFTWTPRPGQAGDYVVTFTVSDGEARVSRPVLLRAALAPEPPRVTVELTPSFPVAPGQRVLVHALASSLAPITHRQVKVAGNLVTLDDQGRATVLAGTPGRTPIEATATDDDGLTAAT